ncbi:hypothetical protein DXB79_13640 [Bacteroides fragilis]|nr:hypothetical protein F9003_14140 [Bacteroides fragilis]RGM86362.1 hypothetical protein DXB89_10190 [Bacteroides fragilis]RGN12961.1 hypothetical protein DXB79_13640 [Bacteroides fragilis]TWV49417.1 hypothetical protein FSA01_16185 [Bacteroides fragilis]
MGMVWVDKSLLIFMLTLHCSLIHMASKFNKYPETNPNYHQFSLLFCDYFLFFATNQIKVILKEDQ